ncbi:thiol reductant ABC exporter subunit CydD [Kaistia algarum]|uniref:thiol reductant ABC exporter subunit CydD n=1 Tax=Kaistia algarum TaxID=2083279 RepID=UPI000CE74651|nr:thiol reductant ABC exporter subunit CydD [Kaistia algarum]MCX5515288.1 thiol reductant ABC exporter subunit CydD [Kaistia algarum]PPE77697.1 thiol reductant ABC exporter subunit CydD [Kaistia algarum]
MSVVEYDPARSSGTLSSEAKGWLSRQRKSAGFWLIATIAVPILVGGLIVVQALLLAGILEAAIIGGRLPSASAMTIGALLLVIAGRTLLAWFGERAASRAAEDIKLVVRQRLFAALLARQPGWMRTRSSGELVSAIVDQVEALDGYFARFLPAMVAATVLPLAFAIGILPVDWVVGLIFLVTAPMIPVFMALVGWGAESASRQHMTAMARLSGLFADRLRGIVVLKLFGRAEDEVQRVRSASDELATRTLAVLKIAFLSSAVLEFFAALGVAGVAVYVGVTYLGAIDLRSAPLGLGAGLFCLLMAPEVYLPLRTLAAHYHDRAAARAAVAGIEAAFEALPDADAPAPAPAIATGQLPRPRPASLAIRGLTVVNPGRGVVLDRIDLDILPGERVALLGASGIGKSTLIEAIGRIRAFEGDIRIDGVPIGEMDEAAFRQNVALLGQRPRLFHGTIASNIRLSRPGASEAELRRSAALAFVTDFAGRLPDGFDTVVGERGRGISGGEAQRVALARIFLRDPGLVLLDEPTAHLDAITEARVADSILDFAAGRTLVIATHSAALARRMDRIYRIAGGRLLPVPHRPHGADGPRAGWGEAP